jgi:hypothetical protein
LIAVRPETGQVDMAQVSALREAMAALPEHDDRRVLLQAVVAKSLVYSSETEERVKLARDALERGRAIADLGLRADILTRCHEALADPEHLGERVKIAAELWELAHRQGHPTALLRASQTQIETMLERGDMDAFEAALTNMESLAERIREPFYRWHAKAVRGTQALIFGQTALAERCAREALEFGARFGEETARHMYCTQMVGLLQMQGRLAEAEPLAREMMLLHAGVRGWVARVGVIDGLLGRREQARRCLGEIMARGLDWIHREPFALSGLCTVADLCGVVRDATAAKELYDALLPHAEHYGLTYLGAATYGPITRYLAGLAEVQGMFVVAEAHYRRALECAAAIRSPTYQALSGAAYARLLARSGGATRRNDAIAVLHEARMHAERSELHGVTHFLGQLARRFGLPATAPDPWVLHSKRGEA